MAALWFLCGVLWVGLCMALVALSGLAIAQRVQAKILVQHSELLSTLAIAEGVTTVHQKGAPELNMQTMPARVRLIWWWERVVARWRKLLNL